MEKRENNKLKQNKNFFSFPGARNFTIGMSSLILLCYNYCQRIHIVGFSLRERKSGAAVRTGGRDCCVRTGSDEVYPWGSQSSYCLKAPGREGRVALVESVSMRSA